jgi:hypothetical protein
VDIRSVQRNRPVPVTALIDWNSQIYAAKQRKAPSEIAKAERTLSYVGRMIGRALVSAEKTQRYDVSLRLYHGWRRGFEITKRRTAMVTAAARADFPSLSNQSTVVVRENLGYGDRLLSALPSRLLNRKDCHFADSLRPSLADKSRLEEKMIDTAIASDLVDLAHREPERWLIVMGDDDDLVPAVLVAEGILAQSDARMILIRTRPPSPFVMLDGLTYKP